VVELFERGVLRHPPISSWDLRRGPEAFRHMREARHVGKIVLTLPRAPDPDGTVLITGGTGALGAATARHLVTHHRVRHLVLTGRRGADAPGTAALRAELAEAGARVTFERCDVADPDAVRRLVDSIPPEHPLTAVIHAAGVLQDATLLSLTAEHVEAVLNAKAVGAWNLHQATADRDLSLFVCFSSIAGVLGAAGQGNYAAANAYLDALAHHRHHAGLPASALSWGQWSTGGGMAGRLAESDRARLARTGIAPMPAAAALALFDAAVLSGRPHLVPARLTAAVSSPGTRTTGPPAAGDGLMRRLAGRPPAEQRQTVLALIRADAATILGHEDPAAIGVDRGFQDMGFTSLGMVEFRNLVGATVGLSLPATLAFDYPTPAALADHLVARLAEALAGRAASTALDELARLESALGTVRLDDAGLRDEISSRLQELLATVGRRPSEREQVTATILSASADEVIRFIDNEFGDGSADPSPLNGVSTDAQ
jgi:short-subunit dehydrogenase